MVIASLSVKRAEYWPKFQESRILGNQKLDNLWIEVDTAYERACSAYVLGNGNGGDASAKAFNSLLERAEKELANVPKIHPTKV